MRKIIGSLFQSLDGVIQAPGGPEEDQTGFAHGGWVFPYFDDSLDEPMGRLLGGSYELLLGRRTYEIFAAYWPHNGDQPIGQTFNAVRKHVVTSSDRPLTWNNSQRLVGDPADAVARLVVRIELDSGQAAEGFVSVAATTCSTRHGPLGCSARSISVVAATTTAANALSTAFSLMDDAKMRASLHGIGGVG
jgi:hypothetical protein